MRIAVAILGGLLAVVLLLDAALRSIGPIPVSNTTTALW